MKRHVMIDIETMGKGPRAAILAIGAVEFDPVGQSRSPSFYRAVSLASSIAAGLEMDAETVVWWMGQPDAARAAASAGGSNDSLESALRLLSTFLIGDALSDEKEDLIVWANGASFDFPILSEAFRLCGIEKPWHYWNERCHRTLRKVIPGVVEPERAGDKHNALDDAAHQAASLQAILAALGQMPAVAS